MSRGDRSEGLENPLGLEAANPSEPETVLVWWVSLEDFRPGHLDILDPREAERSARLARPEDRQRLALGCRLLRGVVGRILSVDPSQVDIDRACPHCQAAHGRPRVVGHASLSCSVSHSGDLVLAAVVDSGELGVDVEAGPEEDWAALLDDLCAPNEARPRSQAEFLTTWTRKEALLKATGRGLLTPMMSLSLGAPEQAPQVVIGPDGSRIVDLRLPRGMIGALAIIGHRAPWIAQSRHGGALVSLPGHRT